MDRGKGSLLQLIDKMTTGLLALERHIAPHCGKGVTAKNRIMVILTWPSPKRSKTCWRLKNQLAYRMMEWLTQT